MIKLIFHLQCKMDITAEIDILTADELSK
ncbi:hypothetical protein SCB49_03179 [unidentified eubacterium SCB49]|nr:hypothetical protein SCB49_03179 [unidentified eubacterium SCB49]